MSTEDGDVRRRLRQVVDVAAYAVVVDGVLAVGVAAVSVVGGRGLVGAKWVLFFVGLGLLAYATAGLRPRRPATDETRPPPRGLGRLVAERLPASVRPAPEQRPRPAVKHFVAGVGLLALTYVAEVALGVGPQ